MSQKKYTMNRAAKEIGTTRQSILRWIAAKKIAPRTVATDLTPKGFVYEFSDDDLAKMKNLVRGAGRPKSTE